MKTFQVNTKSIPEVKKLLVELYNKHVATSSFRCFNDNPFPYLQFWFNDIKEEDYKIGDITHNTKAYKNYPVLSIEKAIETLKNYKQTETFSLCKDISLTINRETKQIFFDDEEIPKQIIEYLYAIVKNKH